MSTTSQLNLRPQERRVLVGVGLTVFIVLNVVFVWPLFDDWKELQNRSFQLQRSLSTYQKEVAEIPAREERLKKLQSTGSDVLSEELQLQRIINTQAITNGVLITNFDPRPRSGTSRTNQFFEEQILVIDYSTGPEELVNFLVSLASGNSMIRIREMNVKPDPTQTKLLGSITFVASYQKKTATPRAPAPATARSPVAARQP